MIEIKVSFDSFKKVFIRIYIINKKNQWDSNRGVGEVEIDPD